jgi:hypothetical protein
MISSIPSGLRILDGFDRDNICVPLCHLFGELSGRKTHAVIFALSPLALDLLHRFLLPCYSGILRLCSTTLQCVLGKDILMTDYKQSVQAVRAFMLLPNMFP